MKSPKELLTISIALSTALILSGCTTDGGISDPKSSTSTTTKASNSVSDVSVTGELGSAPVFESPKGTPPTDLIIKDLVVGTGPETAATSQVTANYTLKAWSTGEVVDSSWSRGTPLQFSLSGVIEGWQKGIPGMKVGGRRLLIVPPSLGYGAQAVGPMKPNETLIFVVDLVGVA